MIGGDLRAEGAFCCLQPRLWLLEELQVGLSFLGRMSLVKEPGVPLLRSGLCFPGAWGNVQGQVHFDEDLLMWGRQSSGLGVEYQL